MYIKPNEEMKKEGLEWGWSAEEVERGYTIFDFDGTGILEIERIKDMYSFLDEIKRIEDMSSSLGDDEYGDVTDEDCARHAEESGFCKIIPVDELPPHMMYGGYNRRYYGYVDTPENRERIRNFYAEQN